MKVWECRDLGETKEYLGIRIIRDQKRQTLTLDQCVYVEKVLKRFEMHKSAWTPLPTGYNPKISETKATSDLRSQYQSVIGSLLYIMLGTPPDIAFAVIRISQFCANPSQEHLSRALYIVRCLGSTKNLALHFNGANHNGFLGYTDSDWAANPDDRKSITGYVLFLAKFPCLMVNQMTENCSIVFQQKPSIWPCSTRQGRYLGSNHSWWRFTSPYQKFCFTVITRKRSFWQPIQPRNNDLNTLEYVTTTSENVWKKEIRLISSIFQLENRSLISLPRIFRQSSSKPYGKTFV